MCKGLCGFSFFFLLDFPSCYVHTFICRSEEESVATEKRGMSDSFESEISFFFFLLLDSLILVDLSSCLSSGLSRAVGRIQSVSYSVRSALVTQPELKMSSGELAALNWSVTKADLYYAERGLFA